jgi:hypothetical protein
MRETPRQIPRQAGRRRGPLALFADFILGLQERVLWPLADALRAGPAALRRGLGALGYSLERVFVWPFTDRFALLSAPVRALAVVGLALVVGVGVAVALANRSKDSTATVVSQVAAVPAPAPRASAPAAPEEPEPTLHGASPVFTPPARKPAPKAGVGGEGGASGEADASASAGTGEPAATTSTGSSPAASEKISSYPSASRPTAAETSEIPGPTAGARAIAVAREFSGAFVVYETKGKSADVRRTFTATATPDLTKALLKRPPHQPSKVRVPRAKVLNVVPGPSRGSVFTVSVSLLRVGVTSELRLEMEKLKKQGWRVTNVLG